MATNAESPGPRRDHATGADLPAAIVPLDPPLRRVLVALATTYLRHGYWGQAIELLEAGPLIGPEDAVTTGLLAYAYLESGQPARCLEWIDRFLALDASGPLVGAAHLIRARAVRALARAGPAAIAASGDAGRLQAGA
jgi:hypothetical protein